MMRRDVMPRGLQQFYMNPHGVRASGRINPKSIHPYSGNITRRPDPASALRKHSELKQPYRFSDYRLMEGSLEPWPEVTVSRAISGLPPIGGMDYPPQPKSWSGIGPWVVDPLPTEGIVGPGGVGGKGGDPGDSPWGQPGIKRGGAAFLGWIVFKGGGFWGYVGNLVIYGHQEAYHFKSANDFFSRIALSPAPGWYAAGTVDLNYFNVSESDTGNRRTGAMAAEGPLPYGEMWGASGLVPDGTLRLRVHWGIDYPPGTENHLDRIHLASTRTGLVRLAVDGWNIPVRGQSVLYREYAGGDADHFYWELNGYRSRLLFGDEVTESGWPSQLCADGYARVDVPEKYPFWPGGEHVD